jgi:hypothetical protein
VDSVRYAYFRGNYQMRARGLSHDFAMGSLDVALDTRYRVPDGDRPWRASPLLLLLGLEDARPSMTRVLEVVTAAGVDWACHELDRERPAAGDELSGSVAADLVLQAIERRREDIDAIVSATELIIGPGDWRESEHAAIRRRVEDALNRPRIRLPERTISRYAAVHPEYESDDLVSLAGVDMLLRGDMLLEGGDGRAATRCHHCGDLFIPDERFDERYCRRAVPGEPPGGRTCQDLGPQQRYHERLDALGRLYRREYKRLDNRQRRGLFTREALDAWRGEARELLATAQADGWDEQRYRKALDEIEPAGAS